MQSHGVCSINCIPWSSHDWLADHGNLHMMIWRLVLHTSGDAWTPVSVAKMLLTPQQPGNLLSALKMNASCSLNHPDMSSAGVDDSSAWPAAHQQQTAGSPASELAADTTLSPHQLSDMFMAVADLEPTGSNKIPVAGTTSKQTTSPNQKAAGTSIKDLHDGTQRQQSARASNASLLIPDGPCQQLQVPSAVSPLAIFQATLGTSSNAAVADDNDDWYGEQDPDPYRLVSPLAAPSHLAVTSPAADSQGAHRVPPVQPVQLSTQPWGTAQKDTPPQPLHSVPSSSAPSSRQTTTGTRGTLRDAKQPDEALVGAAMHAVQVEHEPGAHMLQQPHVNWAATGAVGSDSPDPMPAGLQQLPPAGTGHVHPTLQREFGSSIHRAPDDSLLLSEAVTRRAAVGKDPQQQQQQQQQNGAGLQQQQQVAAPHPPHVWSAKPAAAPPGGRLYVQTPWRGITDPVLSEVLKLKASLSHATCCNDIPRIHMLLGYLYQCTMSPHILFQTQIASTVRALKYHRSKDVSSVAKVLLSHWTSVIRDALETDSAGLDGWQVYSVCSIYSQVDCNAA